VIVVAVRWYLRYGLSYRDVEELLVERGVEVDHVTESASAATGTTFSPYHPATSGSSSAMSPATAYGPRS
jgi:hypothetical protein